MTGLGFPISIPGGAESAETLTTMLRHGGAPLWSPHRAWAQMCGGSGGACKALSSAGRKGRRWGFQKLCQERWAGTVGVANGVLASSGQKKEGTYTSQVHRTPQGGSVHTSSPLLKGNPDLQEQAA